MKAFIAIVWIVAAAALMMGCATTGTGTNDQFVTCEDAVAYIATIDAIAATYPKDVYTDEVKAAKAWYALARVGAITYLSKKCPDIVKNLQPAVQ